ncbi:bluetail domain-containing putative surface protein [Microcystis aeruginosa FBCC-A68]|nr:bluetail domain-containing putative surface protein [Microcystis aeruginosa]
MANNFNWIDATTLNGKLWDNGILSSVASINQIGSLSILGASHKYLYTSLINSGTISQNISGHALSLNQSANINNSGIYEFQAGEIRNAPNSIGVFNNSGTFRKTSSGLSIVSVPFYNTGTVNVELGTLLLLGGGSSNGGTFNISSGRILEIKSSSSLTNNTYFLDSNTQISGTGTLMISGGFLELGGDWALPTTTINILRNAGIKSPGTITNAGSLTIQGNAYLYASLNNTGTIVQNLVLSNPSDRLSLNQSANINNSGIYEFQAGEIRNAPNSIGVFNNSGTFRKTSSGLSIVSVPFYNTGTVNVELGTLLLLGGGSSNGGTFNISSGRTLEIKSSSSLTNNTYFLNSNTQISGTGTLMISGGFLELGGDWALPTTTINILRNAGIKSPGTITNAGSLTIQGNAYLYASLNNTGTIVQNLVLSNPSDRLSLNQSANINNSGIYEFQAGEIRNQVDSIGVFNNSGTFRKTSSGLSIVSVPFYNTGTIESLMGTVSFYNSYTHNNANLILKSGNVIFTNPLTINGGNIEGNGNINATITNSGLLNPRYVSNTEFGRLTINGNYTETNNASINIQLGGNTAAVNFDQIDINGTANFDGTLNVSLLNGFTPTLGNTFDVLTYDALNSLSNLDFTGLDINSTLQFLPQWSSNKLTLKVVDKSAPILAIAPTNVVEAESHSGTKPFTFTVTRSGNTTGTNTVNWTVAGTGSNPANATDFGGTLPSGTLTFAANETSKVITVNVNGDIIQESNETFTVTLSNASNGANMATATATATIQNDDFIGNSSNNTLTGTAGNDYINGGAGRDTLTGGAGNDIFVFRFGQSPVSGADWITDFAIGSDKIDLLSSSGVAMNAPISFTCAADSTATTLTNMTNSVFTDANGALTGNQALGVNSAALVNVTTSGIAWTYLVINDGVAGFQSSNDLLVNITGYSGTLPALGSIDVSSFFI